MHISFLKSNYKYKRRSTRFATKSEQRLHTLLPFHQQTHIHQLPTGEKMTSEDKQILKKIAFWKNIKIYKLLRIFILIMQQAATPSNNSFYLSKSKNVTDNTLARRLVAKLKAIYKINKETMANAFLGNIDKDDTVANYPAYKEDNEDITGKIIHQQHNYGKVSTITSKPIKHQRHNNYQKKATNSSSTKSKTISLNTQTTLTMCTLLSTPPIEKYETCQWTVILRHYVYGNPSKRKHQYRHKTKHIQHTNSLTNKQVFNMNNFRSIKNILNVTTAMSTSVLQSTANFFKATWNKSYSLFCLLLTIFITFTISIRSTAAGACWQTVLENSKCNEIFSLNISKRECCDANQEFAYTDREPTNVEYFFATAIGGGMECSPCLESCTNVKCGLNKKCVKRKGRPKCICAPKCGSARKKSKHKVNFTKQEQKTQHHSSYLIDNINDDGYFQNVPSSNAFQIMPETSHQSRDTRSLSSENTNVNIGLEFGKDAMISSDTISPVERHCCKKHNLSQRILKHKQTHNAHEMVQLHQYNQQPNNKNQEPKGNTRLLITNNVNHTETPTTRRLQIFSNVRTTKAGLQNYKNKYNQQKNCLFSDNDEEHNEEYRNHDGGDNAQEVKKKILNIDSSNRNTRNDDSIGLLNQPPSRRKLKITNKRNNNKKNNKINNKNHHGLKTTIIRQHSSNNNTRNLDPHQNGRHAEQTPHHHQQHHHQQQHRQQQNHNFNIHQQQNPNNSRHKHKNKNEHNKEQTIAIRNPKNNKYYSITTTSSNINSHIKTKIDVVNTAATTSVSNYNTLSYSDANITAIEAPSFPSNHTETTTVQSPAIVAAYNVSFPYTKFSKMLLLSSATSSFSSATPSDSSMSADDGTTADDHNRSILKNHGSKIATSSLLSVTASSLSTSYLQMYAVSARPSSESSVITTMAAEGQGVSRHDHYHRSEILKNLTFNNQNNSNGYNTSALQTNLHKNQQQIQQEQLQQTQPQLQHHYHTPLFDVNSEQFALIGFSKNKHHQQRVTNGDNVRPLNPVCGSDGRTYNTECQLRKRACRTDNSNLRVSYVGHCRTTCNGVHCLNGLTCVEDQYTIPHCIKCKIECPQESYDEDDVDEIKAVCGADGKTYKSACDINRMICKIGRSISVAYPGPCQSK